MHGDVGRVKMELKMHENMSNLALFTGFCFELKNSDTNLDKDHRVGRVAHEYRETLGWVSKGQSSRNGLPRSTIISERAAKRI